MGGGGIAYNGAPSLRPLDPKQPEFLIQDLFAIFPFETDKNKVGSSNFYITISLTLV